MIEKIKREEIKRFAEKLVNHDLMNYTFVQKNKILSEAKRQVIQKSKFDNSKKNSQVVPEAEQPTEKEQVAETQIGEENQNENR